MITKRLLAVLCLCASAWATTTVTGNVKNLGTGSVSAGTFVRFYLRGCSGNQPRINGTGIIAPTLGNVYYFDFVPNSSGAISGTLYSTRDSTGLLGGDIECGGSTTAVWYGMVPFVNGKAGPETPIHAKNTATIDISNITPITTNPVVTAPTGDSTYARLDGGNQNFTGAIGAPSATISGALAAGSLIGPFAGLASAWVDVTSAQFGAKCDGVTDDSTALQTAITFGINNNIPVFIHNKCAHSATLNMNVGNQSVWIFGDPFQSALLYTGTGSGVLWKNGNGAPFIFNGFVYGISFECSNVSGCAKNVEAWSISESVFRDVAIANVQNSSFASVDLWCNGCNIIDFDHLILQDQVASNPSMVGIDCIGCSALWIRNGDFFYFTTATIRLSGTTGHITIDGNWFESQDGAVVIDDTSTVTLIDGLQISHNRFLFNGMAGSAPSGGAFANQILLKVNNTGTNSIQMYGVDLSMNSAQFSGSGLSNTAYPIVIGYSATTGASTQMVMGMRGNDFTGATTGMINVVNGPSAAKTVVALDNNINTSAARSPLTTYVNGTATTNNVSDPFGGKDIFGALLTVQAAINGNDGAAATPTYSFTNNTNSGLYNIGGNPAIAAGGTGYVMFGADLVQLKSTTSQCWSASTINGANALCNSQQTAGIEKIGSTAGGSDGYIRSGHRVSVITSDFTTANNTNLQTITGLSWTFPAAALNWSFHCGLSYSQATANVAVAFGIQAATNAPNNIFANGVQQITVGPPATFVAGTLATLNTTTATAIVTGTPGALATNYTVTLDGTFELPNSVNTVNIMVSTATGTDAVTVKRGSYCELY